jgi:protein-tyrosine kinase
MAEADPHQEPSTRDDVLNSFKPVVPQKSTLARNKVVGFDSRDVQSRPFMLLRTRVAKEIQARGARLLGVTSPTPSAGKSLLAVNLAASLARLGEYPVYLVDLDLRRGSVSDCLGIEASPGLDSYLRGDATRLEDVGLRIEGVRLGVLPTAQVGTSSAEYLSGERFACLMSTLRDLSADATVIVDLPPVFANDDAMICVEALDGYMMVVESGRTTRRQVIDAMEMLKPSACIGTILNRYKASILDDYGYGSSAYSQYYREPSP